MKVMEMGEVGDHIFISTGLPLMDVWAYGHTAHAYSHD